MPRNIPFASSGGVNVPSTPWPRRFKRLWSTDDYCYATTDFGEEALEAGYVNKTFSADFSDLSQFVLKETFSGAAVESLEGVGVSNGILIFSEQANKTNIVATADISDATFNSGVAFGGGGYFEFSLRFDPTDTLTSEQKANGWPAAWALGVSDTASDFQWTGQAAGYRSQVEVDIMESLNALYDGSDPDTYSYLCHLRHHYGIQYTTCSPSQWCMVDSKGSYWYPSETDHTQFHKYGMLWIPATASSQGYIKFFFDGVHTGSVLPNTVSRTHVWDQYDGSETPPPVEGSTAFNILDNQYLALILNTGTGMKFEAESIEVWQASAANNLTQ